MRLRSDLLNAGTRGLQVSLGGLLQDELVKRQIGDRLAKPVVPELKLLQPLYLFDLHPARFLAPAMVGHLAHTDLTDCFATISSLGRQTGSSRPARHRRRGDRTTASRSTCWRRRRRRRSFSIACWRAAPTARIVACVMAENSRTPEIDRMPLLGLANHGLGAV
jgi:hypothetical protein